MILLRRRALTGGDMPGPGPGPGPTPGGSAAGDLLVGQTVAIKESGTDPLSGGSPGQSGREAL